MHRFTSPPTRQILGRALLVGFAAGLRSMTPIGVLATERNDASLQGGWKDWPVLSNPAGRVALQTSTVGEMVMDKTPFVPPRTEAGALGGRIAFGAIAGLAMGTLRKGAASKVIGALGGGIAAAVGSHAGYAYRTGVTKVTGLPDLPVALVEDVAAILIARKGVRG